MSNPFWRRVVLAVVLFAPALRAQEPEHATTRSFNRALGVECVFCHASEGAENAAPRATAARMIAMVDALNQRLAPVRGHVTCWTCHAGARVPARLEPARWQQVLGDWPAGAPAADDVKRTMAVYTASVGRRCAGCHDQGGAGAATEEAVHLVRTMNSLFPVMEKFLPPAARTQCFMCHKGRPHPQVRPND